MKEITAEEVALHTDLEDAWVIIDGHVYDISHWHMEHPGGSDILMENAGQDVSSYFNAIAHSEEAVEIRETFLVGKLVAKCRI